MIKIRLEQPAYALPLEAVLSAGRWACDNERVERLLNAMRAPWDAQAELSEAQIVSKVLGAEIIEASS